MPSISELKQPLRLPRVSPGARPVTRLVDCFSELMAYVVAFRDTAASQQLPYEQMRGEIMRLLMRSEQLSAKGDFRNDEYDAARYAVCAWIDESVLAADWAYKSKWRSEPLQRVTYNSTDAGERFFTRLAALGAHQNGVREVFYLCLALGFEGRYCGPEGAYMLQQIKAQHLKLLFDSLPEVPSVAAMEKNLLFPEAWPKGPAPRPPVLRTGQPLFTAVVIGGSTILLLVFYGVYWLSLRGLGENILRAVGK